ncbi:MAG: hypothetical protein ACE5IP_09190 [Terriglobia bacterium]
MSIEHIWSVLCRQALISKDSNNITLVEVIERIRLSQLPQEGISPISLQLVTLWGRPVISEPSRGRARWRLVDPEGNEMAEPVVYDIDLTTFVRARNRSQMSALPIRGPGKYVFCVEMEAEGNWIPVARVPVEVAIEPS